eukprot:762796-Hanusia_phi.AAC.3
MQHHHRSQLKQKNKPFKSSGPSKKAIKKANSGRVELKNAPGASSTSKGRAERINKARQALTEQRRKTLNARRGLDASCAPRLCVLMKITRSASLAQAKVLLREKNSEEMQDGAGNDMMTVQLENASQRLTAIDAPADPLMLMDVMIVTDVVLLVIDAQEEVDAKSQHMINLIKAYGIPPTIIAVLQNFSESAGPKHESPIKVWGAKLKNMFNRDVKVFGGSTVDRLSVRRHLSNVSIPVRPSWSNRSSVLAENLQIQDDGQSKDALIGITGYVRNASLNVNKLFHIPSFGTYQASHVVIHGDPHRIGKGGKEIGGAEDEKTVIPDQEEQESLMMEHEVDEMDQEQTWPTEEEMQGKKKVKKVPKGTGSYQAAWYVDNDDEYEGSDGETGDENEDEGDHESQESDEESEQEILEDEDEDEDDQDMQDDDHDQEKEMEEFLRLKKEAKENEMFPDEIDVPLDSKVPARTRFQKYRGVKSLRSSPWDPNENLPRDYAKISHFKNANASKARALADAKVAGIDVGSYVTLWLRVPREQLESTASYCRDVMESHKALVVVGLLKYENNMTVMNCSIDRFKEDGDVIKGKDSLILVCGMRRMEVQPIYSEQKNNRWS